MVKAAAISDGSRYEEARRQRIQQNLKQLQDLGIAKLSDELKSMKPAITRASPKPRNKYEVTDVRRSSRARNSVTYKDDFDDKILQEPRRRYSRSAAARDYNGRVASYEQEARAAKKAEDLQRKLDNPSFVKSMVRSHVSSCFWLGLPTSFCKMHLPTRECNMVLEDEDGQESRAVYIGNRTGLSGGWKGFAMEHKLDTGDALLFELTEPDRFKIYIVKAIEDEDDIEKTKMDGKGAPEAAARKEGSDSATSVEQTNSEDLKGAKRRKRRSR